jgi:hypothetical protein
VGKSAAGMQDLRMEEKMRAKVVVVVVVVVVVG